MSTQIISKRDQRIAMYRQSVFDYGFLVLCMLIDHFSDDEDYEESGLVKSILEDINEELKLDYPTKYGDEAFEYYENLLMTLQGNVPVNYKDTCRRNMFRVLKSLP